jgi:hypothetical protein
VAVGLVEAVLRLYQEKYADLNVRHFHEKVREAHQIKLHVGEGGAARSGAGEEGAEARGTSEAATALLEMENNIRKIMGYRDLCMLKAALDPNVSAKKKVA